MKNPATTVQKLLPARIAEAGIDEGMYDLAVTGDLTDELAWLATSDRVLWIDQLTSTTPRLGTGRAVMAEICMLADEHGCALALNPWAQGHAGALRQDELERFYLSMGFGWRRDHVMVRDPGAQTVVNVRHDVTYLPQPNRVELVFGDTQPRDDLTRTSFALPVLEDGSIVMADNRRRGPEIAGGHIERGESQRDAAGREVDEEVGATVGPLVAIGHLRMLSSGIAPRGWSYPHPLGYQSFFAGRLVAMRDYVENDECLAPRIVTDLSTLKPHVRLLAMRARAVVGAARPEDHP